MYCIFPFTLFPRHPISLPSVKPTLQQGLVVLKATPKVLNVMQWGLFVQINSLLINVMTTKGPKFFFFYLIALLKLLNTKINISI